MLEQIGDHIVNSFDFGYVVTVNILTYILIKILDYINKELKVTKLQKRILLIFSIVIVATVYILLDYDSKIILFNSTIITPITWSWILKPLCQKAGIDYKHINN